MISWRYHSAWDKGLDTVVGLRLGPSTWSRTMYDGLPWLRRNKIDDVAAPGATYVELALSGVRSGNQWRVLSAADNTLMPAERSTQRTSFVNPFSAMTCLYHIMAPARWKWTEIIQWNKFRFESTKLFQPSHIALNKTLKRFSSRRSQYAYVNACLNQLKRFTAVLVFYFKCATAEVKDLFQFYFSCAGIIGYNDVTEMSIKPSRHVVGLLSVSAF